MKNGQMPRGTVPLTKSALTRVKIKAIRRGLWFRVLNRLERASIDLTIRVVEKAQSSVLKKMLTSIIKKLSDAMDNKIARMMRTVGCNLAQKMSQIAQEWGNTSAVKWETDTGFIRYLAVMRINTSPMFNE